MIVLDAGVGDRDDDIGCIMANVPALRRVDIRIRQGVRGRAGVVQPPHLALAVGGIVRGNAREDKVVRLGVVDEFIEGSDVGHRLRLGTGGVGFRELGEDIRSRFHGADRITHFPQRGHRLARIDPMPEAEHQVIRDRCTEQLHLLQSRLRIDGDRFLKPDAWVFEVRLHDPHPLSSGKFPRVIHPLLGNRPLHPVRRLLGFCGNRFNGRGLHGLRASLGRGFRNRGHRAGLALRRNPRRRPRTCGPRGVRSLAVEGQRKDETKQAD